MTITLKQLRSLGACHEQLIKFEQTFGKSVEVTEELAVQYAHDFDINWLASKVLTDDKWQAYDEAMDPAREAYKEAKATALKAYEEAKARAFVRSLK